MKDRCGYCARSDPAYKKLRVALCRPSSVRRLFVRRVLEATPRKPQHVYFTNARPGVLSVSLPASRGALPFHSLGDGVGLRTPVEDLRCYLETTYAACSRVLKQCLFQAHFAGYKTVHVRQDLYQRKACSTFPHLRASGLRPQASVLSAEHPYLKPASR